MVMPNGAFGAPISTSLACPHQPTLKAPVWAGGDEGSLKVYLIILSFALLACATLPFGSWGVPGLPHSLPGVCQAVDVILQELVA